MRRAHFDQFPRVHHGDLIGNSERFGLVVGDKNSRDVDPSLERLDLEPHLHSQLRVQVAQGLVQKHDLGLVHQGPGKSDPLLLAAGEFRRRPVFQTVQPDDF